MSGKDEREKAEPTADNHWLFGRAGSAKYVKPDVLTLRALEELDSINNMAEFIEICREQERKRGWGLAKPVFSHPESNGHT